MKITNHSDGRLVLGFIDDDKSLYYQWIYGFVVLGGLAELPGLIERKKIQRILIVSDLQPESRAAVEQIAVQHGVKLSEWCPEERPIRLPQSGH